MTGCILQQHLASAQTAEVEQLTLNIEKLAQLKQILADMKKGYQVASQGYGRIRDISKGNFSLHETFLNGLMTVNPGLRKYKKVADIISFQEQILTEYRSAFKRFQTGGRFTPEEMEYMAGVYGNLLDRSVQNLDELAMVITSGKLRMSDDERIEAIDRLYLDMQEKVAVLRRFNKKAAAVDRQRETMQRESEVLKKLQGQ